MTDELQDDNYIRAMALYGRCEKDHPNPATTGMAKYSSIRRD